MDGELCYSLKADATKGEKTIAGKANSLLLILDSGMLNNKEDGLSAEYQPDMHIVSLNLDNEPTSKNPIRIHFDTLASYSDHRVGSYSLQSLKRITGTKNYLELPKKECQIELEQYV